MPRPPGTPNASKRGGRARGSLDKGQRTVVTAQMAADILDVYNMLGGPAFLYRWAKENPSAFVNGPLARLMPIPPKEDPDVLVQQVSIGSDLDAVMRIAFALNKGLELQKEQQALTAVQEKPDE